MRLFTAHRKNARKYSVCAAREKQARRAQALFMALEPRRMFSVINITSFGAVANSGGNSQGAIQNALNSAKPGDTVVFPAGSFNVSGSLNVPTGVAVAGAGSTSTDVSFNVNRGSYGFNIDGNDSNVTIEGLNVTSNYGDIGMEQGNSYNNVDIVGNSFQYGHGASGGSVWGDGIEITIANNATTIEYNYFHDSTEGGVRNWSIYWETNAQLNYNLSYNVWDAGHMMVPNSASATNSYSYNYGTNIMNKGAEIQGFGTQSQGSFDIIGNVFYNWESPTNISFGISLASQYSAHDVVSGNYLAATIAPGSSFAPGQHNFGYGIEFGGVNGLVSDNTLVGPWYPIVVSSHNVQVDGNKIYGQYSYYYPKTATSYVATEVGGPSPSFVLGTGSQANVVDPNQSDAPAPPANTFAGPSFWSSSKIGVAVTSGDAVQSVTPVSQTTTTDVQTPAVQTITPAVQTSGSQSTSTSTAVQPSTSTGHVRWHHWLGHKS
jgi:hypothetical protein